METAKQPRETTQPTQRGLLQETISPEMRNQFDLFVADGISIIYDEKVSKGLINRIIKNDDPVEAIAKATLDDIVERLETSAKKNGMDLSDAVLIQGANQLMGEIITLVETAGMKPLTDEQKYQAFSLATSLYLDRVVKSGKISPEELQGMARDASQTSEGQRILQRLRSEEGQQVPGQQQQIQEVPSQQIPPPQVGRRV